MKSKTKEIFSGNFTKKLQSVTAEKCSLNDQSLNYLRIMIVSRSVEWQQILAKIKMFPDQHEFQQHSQLKLRSPYAIQLLIKLSCHTQGGTTLKTIQLFRWVLFKREQDIFYFTHFSGSNFLNANVAKS